MAGEPPQELDLSDFRFSPLGQRTRPLRGWLSSAIKNGVLHQLQLSDVWGRIRICGFAVMFGGRD